MNCLALVGWSCPALRLANKCKPDALTAELTALALYCKHLSARAGRKFALILSNRALSVRFLMACPPRLLCSP
jgi:hypothetical protein